MSKENGTYQKLLIHSFDKVRVVRFLHAKSPDSRGQWERLPAHRLRLRPSESGPRRAPQTGRALVGLSVEQSHLVFGRPGTSAPVDPSGPAPGRARPAAGHRPGSAGI